jgi:dUTP pyrophosphatase
MKIKFINKSKHDAPQYATAGASGMDIKANLTDSISLSPLQRALVPTGIYLEMPIGLECQVRPRSGLALKKGLTVLNSPGTIDADYRGEVGVILINLSSEQVTIEDGERIAQLVFCPVSLVELQETNGLSDSERGAGGFGSTGTK